MFPKTLLCYYSISSIDVLSGHIIKEGLIKNHTMMLTGSLQGCKQANNIPFSTTKNIELEHQLALPLVVLFLLENRNQNSISSNNIITGDIKKGPLKGPFVILIIQQSRPFIE